MSAFDESFRAASLVLGFEVVLHTREGHREFHLEVIARIAAPGSQTESISGLRQIQADMQRVGMITGGAVCWMVLWPIASNVPRRSQLSSWWSSPSISIIIDPSGVSVRLQITSILQYFTHAVNGCTYGALILATGRICQRRIPYRLQVSLSGVVCKSELQEG